MTRLYRPALATQRPSSQTEHCSTPEPESRDQPLLSAQPSTPPKAPDCCAPLEESRAALSLRSRSQIRARLEGPDLENSAPPPPRLSPDQARLVAEHMRLSKAMAIRISRLAGEDLLMSRDLESVGYEALVEAALRYDPNHEKASSFAAFAICRVRGAMLDALRKLSPGRRLRDRFGLEGRSGPAPLIQRMPNHETREDRRLIDQTPTFDERLQRAQLRSQLRQALSKLSAAEQALLHELYTQQRSMRSLANELKVSTATISRRHARLLKKLRRLLSHRLPVLELRNADDNHPPNP